MNQSERKRAAILDAAIGEFLENGFQGSSMDAISARAEVSKRTVYNHFKNKEALFQAIVQQLFALSAEQQDYRYYPDRPLAEQLQAIAKRKIQLFDDEHMRRLVRVIFAECIHSPNRITDAMAQYQQKEQGLDHWIGEAIKDGRFKEVDPGYASEQFMGLIKSCSFWPQLLMDKAPLSETEAQQVVDDSVAMFLNYYGCEKSDA